MIFGIGCPHSLEMELDVQFKTFQKWMSDILDVTFQKWMSDISKMDVTFQKWMSDFQVSPEQARNTRWAMNTRPLLDELRHRPRIEAMKYNM